MCARAVPRRRAAHRLAGALAEARPARQRHALRVSCAHLRWQRRGVRGASRPRACRRPRELRRTVDAGGDWTSRGRGGRSGRRAANRPRAAAPRAQCRQGDRHRTRAAPPRRAIVRIVVTTRTVRQSFNGRRAGDAGTGGRGHRAQPGAHRRAGGRQPGRRRAGGPRNRPEAAPVMSLAGIGGTLLPRRYLADGLPAAWVRRSPALERDRRRWLRWWTTVERSCGPASGLRALFDEVASPAFGMLGFRARHVDFESGHARGWLEARAGGPVGFMLLPWAEQPSVLWRDVAHLALDIGAAWCFVLAPPFLSLISATLHASRRAIDFTLPDVLADPE